MFSFREIFKPDCHSSGVLRKKAGAVKLEMNAGVLATTQKCVGRSRRGLPEMTRSFETVYFFHNSKYWWLRINKNFK